MRTPTQIKNELTTLKSDLVSYLLAKGIVGVSVENTFGALVNAVDDIAGIDPNLVVGENLLTANQSDAELGTDGFSIREEPEIMTQDFTEHWQGGASIKCVTTDEYPQGLMVLNEDNILNIQEGISYTFSLYIKGTGTLELKIMGNTEENAVIVPIICTNAWTRYQATLTTDGIYLSIMLTTASGQAATFYIDGLKLELGSVATPWVIGTGGNIDTTIPVVANRNLLTANQSDAETDASGFSSGDNVNNSTITRDTSEYWQGSASIKSVTPNVVAGEGIDIAPLPNVTIGVPYTLSLYVKGSGTVELMLSDIGEGEGRVFDLTPITLTESWVRYQATITPLTSECFALIQTDVQQAATFYIDGIQLELGETATAFQTGGYSDAPVTSANMVKGYSGYADGEKVEGTLIKNPTVDPLVINPNVVMYPMEVMFLLAQGPEVGPTGDIANLPVGLIHFLDRLQVITGDIQYLPFTVTYIESNSPAIEGLLSTLPTGLTHLDLAGTAVHGVYTPNATIDFIELQETDMSAADTDATLIALNANTTVSGIITTAGNRTSDSDTAVSELTVKGWEVDEYGLPTATEAAYGNEGDPSLGYVTITFDGDMADPAGKQAQFTVVVDSVPKTISSVELMETTTQIKLHLSTEITGSPTLVTVSYTKGTVKSATGILLQSIVDLECIVD
jgi:uncharacterized repeat protein (TIGR02059 family)